jgi:hypothetical protein
MPYCPECGTSVGADAAFCPECGASLSTGGVASGEPPEPGSTTTAASDRGREQPPEAAEASAGDGGALQGRFLVNSVVGGGTGFVLGAFLGAVFLPVYFLGIIVGSMVGGLLHDNGSGSGAMVGASAGFVATVPFVILAVAVAVLGVGWLTAQGIPADVSTDMVTGLGVVAILVSAVAVVANVFFGLLGGLAGGAIAED